MKTYKNDLQGEEWLATIKLDGVQVIVQNKVATSRANKPLYNIPALPDGIYEAFKDNWETTVSLVRTHKGDILPETMFFRLDIIDQRLILNVVKTVKEVQQHYQQVLKNGFEGLVLHGSNGKRLKVKPVETYDESVLDIIPGKGKHVGKMGALLTARGKVGTGFTDKDRLEVWSIGDIIELQAMGITPNGKFRHPRFIRRRFDK